MSTKVPITVSNTQKVLIAFRVKVSEIPKDVRGRSLFQAHERSGGGQAASTGKIIFGGYENPKQKKALFDLPALLGRGFRVNNMYTSSVYKEHKVREDVVNICLWLEYHKGASQDTLANEWGDTAARFIVEKLARAYNSATVFDNGNMISVNLIDVMNPEKEADFVLTPRLARKSQHQAPHALVAVPQSTHPIVNLQPDSRLTAFGEALQGALAQKR